MPNSEYSPKKWWYSIYKSDIQVRLIIILHPYLLFNLVLRVKNNLALIWRRFIAKKIEIFMIGEVILHVEETVPHS